MVVRRKSEAGSVIIMLFVMVALFGLLAFAFLRGTTSNIGWLQTEEAKATSTKNLDCTNSTSMALKRLETRGCGDLISYAADGSNNNLGAPTDGSCSLYHPNGGGIKLCGNAPTCDLTKLAIGEACNDEIVYVGISPAGGRMYVTRCDRGMSWNGTDCDGPRDNGVWSTDTVVTGANSNIDGRQNTATLVGLGPQNVAAGYCKSLSAGGLTDWYLPAINELSVLQSVKTQISGLETTGWRLYISSTENNVTDYWLKDYGGSGDKVNTHKFEHSYTVRCFRRD